MLSWPMSRTGGRKLAALWAKSLTEPMSRLFCGSDQLQADQFLFISDIESSVGQGRMGPSRTGDDGAGQLPIFFRIRIKQDQRPTIFKHQELVIARAQEGGMVLADFGLLPQFFAGLGFNAVQ